MSIKNKSICKNCGENLLSSANFKVKIIKRKKIPVKALKYRDNDEKNLNDSIWGVSRFQKYLMKRAISNNYLQITCGNCLDISKQELKRPMNKVKGVSSNIKVNQVTPLCSGSSSKKKKRRKKEVNAGLIIPPSLSNSFAKSETFTPTKSPFTFNPATPQSTEKKPLSSITKKIIKVQEKERDFNKLKEKLIKSKNKPGPRQMMSLKDFLSK